jgi:exosortase
MADAAPTAEAPALAWREHCQRLPSWLWAAFGAFLVLNYAWTVRDLVLGWIERERVVLGLVVLAGAVFLIWDRRERLARAPVRPTLWGIPPVLLSVLLIFVGTRTGLVFLGGMTSVFLRGVSLIVLLCGVVLLLFGWRFMAPLWLPAVLLMFIYPENYLTAYWVPLRLQTVATVVTEKVITGLGIPVVREGHVLRTANFAANVEEACSGIRSLMTVVPTALFVGAYGLRKAGSRVALTLLSVPLTILANLVRVLVTVLLGIYVGTEAAEGFFHYFAGLGIFLLCLGGLLLLVKLLRLVETDVEDESSAVSVPDEPQREHSGGEKPPLVKPAGALAVIGGALFLGLAYQATEVCLMFVNANRFPPKPLAAVSGELGQWQGRDVETPLDAEALRHVSDSLYRQYHRPGRPPVTAMIFYWRKGAGTLLGRRAHLPESCYPYHGMRDVWTEMAELPTASEVLPEVSVRTTAFASADLDLVVTSWQQAPLEPVPTSSVPKGRWELLLYGLKEIVHLHKPYPPELAIQLISPLSGPPEPVVAAQRDLARRLIPDVVAKTFRAEGEPS